MLKRNTIFEEILWKGHDEDFEPTELPQPTAARPGSWEKVQVLTARVMRGLILFHPKDERVIASIEQQDEARNEISALGRAGTRSILLSTLAAKRPCRRRGLLGPS